MLGWDDIVWTKQWNTASNIYIYIYLPTCGLVAILWSDDVIWHSDALSNNGMMHSHSWLCHHFWHVQNPNNLNPYLDLSVSIVSSTVIYVMSPPQLCCMKYYVILDHVDGSVLERCNSSALVLELHLSCTNPSMLLWHKTAEDLNGY